MKEKKVPFFYRLNIIIFLLFLIIQFFGDAVLQNDYHLFKTPPLDVPSLIKFQLSDLASGYTYPFIIEFFLLHFVNLYLFIFKKKFTYHILLACHAVSIVITFAGLILSETILNYLGSFDYLDIISGTIGIFIYIFIGILIRKKAQIKGNYEFSAVPELNLIS